MIYVDFWVISVREKFWILLMSNVIMIFKNKSMIKDIKWCIDF